MPVLWAAQLLVERVRQTRQLHGGVGAAPAAPVLCGQGGVLTADKAAPGWRCDEPGRRPDEVTWSEEEELPGAARRAGEKEEPSRRLGESPDEGPEAGKSWPVF